MLVGRLTLRSLRMVWLTFVRFSSVSCTLFPLPALLGSLAAPLVPLSWEAGAFSAVPLLPLSLGSGDFSAVPFVALSLGSGAFSAVPLVALSFGSVAFSAVPLPSFGLVWAVPLPGCSFISPWAPLLLGSAFCFDSPCWAGVSFWAAPGSRCWEGAAFSSPPLVCAFAGAMHKSSPTAVEAISADLVM